MFNDFRDVGDRLMNSIESHALRLIGENTTTPDVFTDDATGMAQIRASAGDAIQELCSVTGSYTRTYYLILRVGKQFYKLEPRQDYIAYIISAYDRQNSRKLMSTDLQTLTAMDPYWLQSTGPIERYVQIGFDWLALYRIPSEGTDQPVYIGAEELLIGDEGLVFGGYAGVIELKCVCIPKPYAQDTDALHVRDVYQRAAAYYAVSEYYASRGDAGRATEYFAKYLETGGLMQLNPQQTDRQWQFNKWGKPWQDRTR